MTPKLPLRFIALWLVNLGIILALDICLGLRPNLPRFSLLDTGYLYLAIGAALSYVELALWDNLKGNN